MRQERHGHTGMPEFVEMNPFASQCQMRDFQNLVCYPLKSTLWNVKLTEPPCTERYARWCERSAAKAASYSIISIQRFRYGEDYFQFDCMVDDGLGDIEIPVLLLQTLVENSFSHGLTPERKGEISLFITKEKHNDAECLYICVSDNGKGFSAEVLEKIENNGEIYYNNRRHVGLQNIKKRLNLIYGEQAEFHLSNMDENFGAISEVWITQQDKK